MGIALDGSLGQPVSLALRIPHHHAVTSAAVHRAVRRDLDRLVAVLAEPVTSVRRAALVEHVGFILDHLVALHRLQDEVLWPAVLMHRPHLADLAERSAQAHAALVEPVAAARTAALGWKRAPITRTAARRTVGRLADRLEPVVGQDAETVPLACAMLPETSWADIERAQPRVGPTRVARRLFWLLDELPPAQSDQLLAPTATWVHWVLRNGFSGAYNRAAYLMWIGGGNGPAV